MARAAKPLPSQAYLRECFDYNSETGELRWRERPVHHFRNEAWTASHRATARNSRYAGSGITNVGSNGMVRVSLNNSRYHVSRIIWKLVHDEEHPQIDHIDTNRLNNRLDNLRPATPSQNLCNRRRVSYNTSGYKGVTWSKVAKRWLAQIGLEGKNYYLGTFDTPEAAHAAYVEAARRLHGDFARSA